MADGWSWAWLETGPGSRAATVRIVRTCKTPDNATCNVHMLSTLGPLAASCCPLAAMAASTLPPPYVYPTTPLQQTPLVPQGSLRFLPFGVGLACSPGTEPRPSGDGSLVGVWPGVWLAGFLSNAPVLRSHLMASDQVDAPEIRKREREKKKRPRPMRHPRSSHA